MWQDLVNWFAGGGFRPVLWTAVSMLAAGAVYLVVRRQLRASSADAGAVRRQVRLLALGVLLVLLLVLVRIWTAALAEARQPGDRTRAFLENLLWTGALGMVVYLLVKGTQHALITRAVDVDARHKIRRTSSWVGIAVFVVGATFVWASRLQDFGVFLGIVGAGVALSLQETLVCIAGWMVLVVRRPFDVGDRIEIDGRIGDVVGISVFQTSMLEVGNWVKADQSTGRMLIIPNSMLLRHALYNYTKGFPFVWNEFATVVTFESDWEEAKRLMLESAQVESDKIESEVRRQIQQMQARYAIRYEQLRPIVYTSIAAHGVELTLRYLSPVRMRRTTTHRISENILRAFLAHPRIDFAYPTTRFYQHVDGAKAPVGREPEDHARADGEKA